MLDYTILKHIIVDFENKYFITATMHIFVKVRLHITTHKHQSEAGNRHYLTFKIILDSVKSNVPERTGGQQNARVTGEGNGVNCLVMNLHIPTIGRMIQL